MIPIIWRPEDLSPENRQTRIHTHANGVTYLTFRSLDQFPWLMNAFSTRLGGVSPGPFKGMNLSFTQGDEDKNVYENYRLFAEAAGFRSEQIVMSEQTHTTNVVLVTKADCGRGITRPKDWTDVDGMITNEPGVVLSTSYADCVPLYFVDPVRKAIGSSHSGWKGTAGRMGEMTVRAMKKAFGTEAKDLIAVIGPSVCQDCYEVSEDVALQFPECCYYRKENGKYQLDLALANFMILRESGIPEDRIFRPELCTVCNKDFLFSHRASKGLRGNLAAFLMIRD